LGDVLHRRCEQFGTNLRATVATSVPNFVRGATVPMVALFNYLKPSQGVANSAEIVALVAAALAFFALGMLRETFDVRSRLRRDRR